MISSLSFKGNPMCGVCAFLAGTAIFLSVSVCGVQANDGAQATGTKTRTIEIPFTSHDGFEMFGKLTLPSSGGSHAVVVYVQNAEASTMDTKRQGLRGGTYNFLDFYRDKLGDINVGFFSYEGRGVRVGDK